MNDLIETNFITKVLTPGLNAKLQEAGLVATCKKPIGAGITADCIARALGAP